jgi:hypothetical protein
MVICFLDPAPLRPPFIPLLAVNSLWVYLLIPSPWNLGNRTGKGLPLLNARNKVMAEEGGIGNYSGKVFAKMSEDRHAHYGVRREIKKMEAVCVHNIVEEIGERRTESAIEISNEEGISV